MIRDDEDRSPSSTARQNRSAIQARQNDWQQVRATSRTASWDEVISPCVHDAHLSSQLRTGGGGGGGGGGGVAAAAELGRAHKKEYDGQHTAPRMPTGKYTQRYISAGTYAVPAGTRRNGDP